MKNNNSKIILISSLFALAAAFAVPAVRAEEGGAKEKKVSAKDLAKYDANKDGKLDDAEKATMKADKASHRKHKAEHKDGEKGESKAQEN